MRQNIDLLSPGHHSGVADWRESRDGGVHAGVFEVAHKCSVSSHAVAGDASLLRIHWEQAGYQLWQFLGMRVLEIRYKIYLGYLGNVCVHVVVLLPLFCGCINIEACSGSKVIGIVLALNSNLNYIDRMIIQ